MLRFQKLVKSSKLPPSVIIHNGTQRRESNLSEWELKTQISQRRDSTPLSVSERSTNGEPKTTSWLLSDSQSAHWELCLQTPKGQTALWIQISSDSTWSKASRLMNKNRQIQTSRHISWPQNPTIPPVLIWTSLVSSASSLSHRLSMQATGVACLANGILRSPSIWPITPDSCGLMPSITSTTHPKLWKMEIGVTSRPTWLVTSASASSITTTHPSASKFEQPNLKKVTHQPKTTRTMKKHL